VNEVLLWNAAIGGVVFGAVYALIGCSLNVLAGVLRVINFAHGEFIIAGSFFAYALLAGFDLNPLIALPLCAVAFFFVGQGLYYVLVPRLARSDEPETSSFLLMFGVSLMLVSIMTWIFEADIRPMNFSFDPINVTLFKVEDAYGPGRHGRVLVPTARLVALAVNAVIIVALTWFFYRTLPGKALRAATMNHGDQHSSSLGTGVRHRHRARGNNRRASRVGRAFHRPQRRAGHRHHRLHRHRARRPRTPRGRALCRDIVRFRRAILERAPAAGGGAVAVIFMKPQGLFGKATLR